MKTAFRILSVILAAVALLTASACFGEKDEWDGVQVSDNKLAETMQVQSGLVNPPTVVCDLTTKDAYAQLTDGALKPSSVILRINEKYNVVDAEGEKLCSFSSLYGGTLKGKIIPIIYVSDEDGVQRTIKLFTERYDVLDAAVASDNPAYVKAVRKACPQIRGIVEFKELTDVYDAVRLTNANLSSVAVLPQSLAAAENVFYLQSQFKAVWVRPDDSQKLNLYESINSGAYGIVSEDYESVINTLGEYGDYSLTRKPFVVAHRGLPNTYNENSVSGARAAIAAGATHLELDGYLTRDNKIALMHDYTVDRTSDGEGVIENFKLDELQKFKLDLHQPYEPIPSLDDVFEVMKGTDAVLLFEIKSQKTEIVNALKTALETHGMERQVVVITFHTKILDAMAKVLPEIPTANLSGITEDAMDDAVLFFSLFNCGTSASYDSVTPEMNAVLRDRGIVGWFWTYESVRDMTEAVSLGYTGLTTNVADEFINGSISKYVYLKGDSDATIVPVAGAEISIIGVTYKKTEEKIKGKVLYAEDLGDKYAVIASYTAADGETHSFTSYTQTFYVCK